MKEMEENKLLFSRIASIIIKICVVLGIILAFYKLPSIIADKISYKQLKKRDFKQDLTNEEG